MIRRGQGGGSRMDVPENLIGLCRGWHQGRWVSCHMDAQERRIPDADLWAIIARRQGSTQDRIREYLWWLWRQPGKVVRTEEGDEE